mmetsp:Transcript_32707/g.75271  ORF Transcript_32707/g.75271 Transcript_32707/m.75271 type:complete len:522 (-) Transcript_32707:291-1856(-)
MTEDGNGSSSLFLAAASAGTALLAYGTYQFLTYDTRWWWKKRSGDPREANRRPDWEDALIHGTVDAGWERVREEFVHGFRVRGELGAAVCVYHRGRKVVDLWGGYADRSTGRPWERDTMVPIFSSTKGISAMALYMLASRGDLDMDAKVSTYWPEFAAQGKGDVTVRDLVDHAVGLAGVDPPLTLEMLQRSDADRTVRDHIAAAKMEWPAPSDRKGYMAVMLGFYESALVQLTDRRGRTIGKYLREEAFAPLGIADELYIGLPSAVPSSRVARLDGMRGLEGLWPTGALPDGFMWKLLTRPGSYIGRAFRNPQLSAMPSVMDFDRKEVLECEMPAASGVATARAVATMYTAFERAMHDGVHNANPLRLDRTVLRANLSRPARPSRLNGWVDEILGLESCMGGGMLLPPPPELRGTPAAVREGGNRFLAAPGSSSFGTPGAGGSFGFCDSDAEIAYSYVMNRCGQVFMDDPREFALRDKVYEAVEAIKRSEGKEWQNHRHLNVPHYLAKRYVEAHPELAPLS